jgi:hypothetical protein
MPDAEDIVDYVMNRDHLGLKAALDDILADRVQDALEARKEYVGTAMFNPELESEEENEAE